MPATRGTTQPKEDSEVGPDTKRVKHDTPPSESQPPKRTSSRILEKETAKVKEAPKATKEAAPTKVARVPRKASQAAGSGSATTLVKDINSLKIEGSGKQDAKTKSAKVVESKPIVMFNNLPVLHPHQRPSLHLFVWGAGDAGQLAMGPDFFDQLDKPRRSAFVDDGIENDIFGEDEAGLEAIAAGGLQTLFIDEKGTVSTLFTPSLLLFSLYNGIPQIWSCGANDNAALGRPTHMIPDPKDEKQTIEVDVETSLPVSVPSPIKSLVDEGFRAVRVYAGDSISAAISDQGELRIWGTFRVSALSNALHMILILFMVAGKSGPRRLLYRG